MQIRLDLIILIIKTTYFFVKVIRFKKDIEADLFH